MDETKQQTDEQEFNPSHIMTGDYVILMETSGDECESWYYFIRVEGNEENLQHLQKQLDKVEWVIEEDLNTFDLDMEHYVSAQTAKEMSKVDLNANSFHRKFDGKLKRIDFDFHKKDKNYRKIEKVNELLYWGAIENFIDDEDIDEEDLVTCSDENTDNESFSSDEDNEDRRPPSIRMKELLERKQEERRKGKKKLE